VLLEVKNLLGLEIVSDKASNRKLGFTNKEDYQINSRNND
jgi:hypothetical protein